MGDHHNPDPGNEHGHRHGKKRHFLNLPHYPGGSEAFRKFIAENLRYPQRALDSGIEGSVLVEYEISDNGIVMSPRILKGIGYGCDEEALRLIGLLRFEKVKNRGMRLKMTTKTTIRFRLPRTQISYTTTPGRKETEQKPVSVKPAGPEITYSYTVTFGGSEGG
jgi:protein TonB